jgi:hypothetical protein
MKRSSLLDLDDAALVTHYVDIIQKHLGIIFLSRCISVSRKAEQR